MTDTLIDHMERITGHRFSDTELPLRALTHRSYAHERPGTAHNERLEFLGDAVVELAITTLLMRQFPESSEGRLTSLRQRIVKNRTLGEVGRAMGLGPFLRLGKSEAAKASVEPSILGDSVEALFGALYSDGGLEPCLALAEAQLAPHLAEWAIRTAKPAKNQLQELTQARELGVPEYRDTSDGQDHDRTWRTTVIVAGESLAEAEGATKKEAHERAARVAMGLLASRDVT